MKDKGAHICKFKKKSRPSGNDNWARVYQATVIVGKSFNYNLTLHFYK